MNVKPAKGVLFVLNPLQGHKPFRDRVLVEGSDAVAEETIGARVDHVISEGRQVDHSPVLVVGDRQIGDQHHLVLVEWSTVNLVGPQ